MCTDLPAVCLRALPRLLTCCCSLLLPLHATPLSPQVKIGLTKDLPIVVEYQISDMG